eukprot:UN24833
MPISKENNILYCWFGTPDRDNKHICLTEQLPNSIFCRTHAHQVDLRVKAITIP